MTKFIGIIKKWFTDFILAGWIRILYCLLNFSNFIIFNTFTSYLIISKYIFIYWCFSTDWKLYSHLVKFTTLWIEIYVNHHFTILTKLSCVIIFIFFELMFYLITCRIICGRFLGRFYKVTIRIPVEYHLFCKETIIWYLREFHLTRLFHLIWISLNIFAIGLGKLIIALFW